MRRNIFLALFLAFTFSGCASHLSHPSKDKPKTDDLRAEAQATVYGEMPNAAYYTAFYQYLKDCLTNADFSQYQQHPTRKGYAYVTSTLENGDQVKEKVIAWIITLGISEPSDVGIYSAYKTHYFIYSNETGFHEISDELNHHLAGFLDTDNSAKKTRNQDKSTVSIDP